MWARTNELAKHYLLTEDVLEASLDHDLGYEDVELPDDPDELAEVLVLRGQAEETGLDLVKWMVANRTVPPMVKIHSWNPGGALEMAKVLFESGLSKEIVIEPFRP